MPRPGINLDGAWHAGAFVVEAQPSCFLRPASAYHVQASFGICVHASPYTNHCSAEANTEPINFKDEDGTDRST